MENIFISSGGFRNKLISQVAEYCKLIGCKNIEFSAGPYQEEIIDKLLNLESEDYGIQIHNYFPVPRKSFVLNLASLNEEIWQKSFDHCVNAINLASLLKTKRYSVHCGFCYDPKTSELGRPFKQDSLFVREDYINKFIRTVNDLTKFAFKKGVDFYIENNVVIPENIRDGKNLLLGTTLEEILELKKETSAKILIDTGHLIVSAKTLNLEENKQLELAQNYADAYHLSSNNRLRDQNKPFHIDNKIMFAIKKDADFYTIEVYAKLEEIKSSFENLADFLN